MHEQLDDFERWKLVSYEDYKPLMVRPNAKGQITAGQRLRAATSKWFFEDRIAPVNATDLANQHHEGGHHEELPAVAEAVQTKPVES